MHLRQQFFFALVSSDAYPEPSAAVVSFEDDHLGTAGGAHAAFSSDMEPLDICQRDPPFMKLVVKYNFVPCQNELTVARPVQHQYDKRYRHKQDDDIEYRIGNERRHSIERNRAADPAIKYQRDHIQERLLIIEIKLVFEYPRIVL